MFIGQAIAEIQRRGQVALDAEIAEQISLADAHLIQRL